MNLIKIAISLVLIFFASYSGYYFKENYQMNAKRVELLSELEKRVQNIKPDEITSLMDSLKAFKTGEYEMPVNLKSNQNQSQNQYQNNYSFSKEKAKQFKMKTQQMVNQVRNLKLKRIDFKPFKQSERNKYLKYNR